VLSEADVGRTIRHVAFASNDDGPATATSNETAVVEEPAANPPTTTSNPTVSGTAKVGRTLTGTPTAWQDATSEEYGWERSADGANWSTIAGASATTYVLTEADVDRRVRFVHFATNGGGTARASSTPTAFVAGLTPPTKPGNPSISGVVKPTRRLTAQPITWGGATSTSRRWERSDDDGATWTAIPGATGDYHDLTSDDLGKKVRFVQTASNADGTSTAASNVLGPVVPLEPPTTDELPRVTGRATIGQVLTADPVSWTGADEVERVWERSSLDGLTWTPIAGATATTYTLTSADYNRRIRFAERARNGDGTTPALSEATAAVNVPSPPSKQGDPVVSGTPKQGHTLTTTTIGWIGADTQSIRWERSADRSQWSTIEGATETTYRLAAADVGRFIRSVAVATNIDGTRQAPSESTEAVAGLAIPVNYAAPFISGTRQAGFTLTAAEGGWCCVTGGYGYRWQRQTGDGWQDIPGATASSYVPTADDVGRSIRVLVTATGVDGSASAASEPITITQQPSPAFTVPAVTVTPPAPFVPPAPPVAPPVVTPPGPATPPAPPVQQLRLTGKTLLAFTVVPRGSSLTLALAAPVKLKAGKYVLSVCVKTKCTKKSFKASGKATKLPAVKVAAKKGDKLKATLTGKGVKSAGTLTVR
jgi:hypothetical protein